MFNFSNPLRFQKLADKILPYALLLAVMNFLLGLYFAFFQSPPDYLQGETVRIMYVHVPCAWLSLMIYSIMAVCSFISIVFKHTLADIISRSCAPVGACFTLATLITGSIWGKPTWGTWWVWDARLTSELILFFIYVGHILISNAYEDKIKGDRNAAILTLLGIVNLPVIKWSVDWWNTLHQPASISKFSSPSIDVAMMTPLIFMSIAFLSFFISLILLRIKGEILIRKIDIIKFSRA
ncbi:MAG: heme transporter HemC [Rickettsiales bacterium]|nr:heme transporter HemC [Rickettsiales bacterium]|tara:strand:+ start:3869 stop:4582 length:714 start_codon:yes stop_codon:yes gene_type:complete